MELKRSRARVVAASVFVLSLGLSTLAFAEHLHGVIAQHHDDGTLTLQGDDASTVTVLVGDTTKVRREDGMRSAKASAASLVPGLRVEVDGRYRDSGHFAAVRVTFRTSAMATALAIQAGLAATGARVDANAQRIAQQDAILRQQAQQIADNDAKIAATAGMASAAGERLSRLGDYDIIGSCTVYFANGESTVSSKYRHQLERMIAQAKSLRDDLRGYVLQVQGYASAVGPDTLNERLSTERAVAVTRILQQNGVPATSIATPAGMGITNQVTANHTEKGQAENRRAVVTLLHNKGMTGR